ncbi:uncharacterized protein LOC123499970 [Portunus trituberculatus]|uniref:uncharacterized protein LOC123499970 n=1 Tax=Portunus trituberculatus TaxID=210409 RepID=UPI001E1D0514|nr:uncharacterized protein LOC123499970 [Portunus trituberculatus]XP_045104439.1 uncharacterized protein LOC123499970 [Portunus trituberculatus]XP_045104440.1 uncharacterized protein LOC123499970 [Portunus trituberculatus]XP_045104441.1 uncharacterized protein LOC123499970 [Portunus trituberculatus]XP_045104442.1 uncharacterized protein LOC123499970 [Portunus trituberculatus]XP_045104443.1 uncharacterized protein LOC123499970 [Portunus trituberculatus]XP_045104444.1 uncharacterized protein LO
MFYENRDYNAVPGRGYIAFGINSSFNLPTYHQNRISSLAVLSYSMTPNDHSINLFEGPSCTLGSHKIITSKRSFGSAPMKFSSLILLGNSPWTLYTKEHFRGLRICVHPNVYYLEMQPRNSQKNYKLLSKFNIGIYANMTMFGTIGSCKIGCFSRRNANDVKLFLGRTDTEDGWGSLIYSHH